MSRKAKHTEEQRISAVEEYPAGKGSQREICTKYKISDTKTLRTWIKWYNSGKDFKEHSSSERGVTMKKGRKTRNTSRGSVFSNQISE